MNFGNLKLSDWVNNTSPSIHNRVILSKSEIAHPFSDVFVQVYRTTALNEVDARFGNDVRDDLQPLLHLMYPDISFIHYGLLCFRNLDIEPVKNIVDKFIVKMDRLKLFL